jgi:phosphatidylglycerophosphate synthase
MNRKLWPNLLSATRIALMPAVLAAGLAGSRLWFVILITVSLATDMLDGFFARRFNAFTDFGRKLDSAADYLTMMTGIASIALLWPEIMRRELPWVMAGLAAFFAVIVLGFVRLGHAPCYHTWATKVGVVLCPLTLIPLLNDWTAMPFHSAMSLLILAGMEEVAIALLLPKHVGEMPTLWHAWRERRGGGGQNAGGRTRDTAGQG